MQVPIVSFKKEKAEQKKNKVMGHRATSPLFRAQRMDNSYSILHFYDFFVVTFFFRLQRESTSEKIGVTWYISRAQTPLSPQTVSPRMNVMAWN